MTVNYKIYLEDKKKFFEKHKYNFKTETSPMDEYGRYHKTYNFEDGAQWMETMSPQYVTETIEIKFVKMNVEVKLLRTEYWNTEAGSKYYYEKF